MDWWFIDWLIWYLLVMKPIFFRIWTICLIIEEFSISGWPVEKSQHSPDERRRKRVPASPCHVGPHHFQPNSGPLCRHAIALSGGIRGAAFDRARWIRPCLSSTERVKGKKQLWQVDSAVWMVAEISLVHCDLQSRHRVDGQEYAVKKIQLPRKSSRENILKIFREVKVLAGLHHKHVVGYNAAWLELDNDSGTKLSPAHRYWGVSFSPPPPPTPWLTSFSMAPYRLIDPLWT